MMVRKIERTIVGGVTPDRPWQELLQSFEAARDEWSAIEAVVHLELVSAAMARRRFDSTLAIRTTWQAHRLGAPVRTTMDLALRPNALNSVARSRRKSPHEKNGRLPPGG